MGTSLLYQYKKIMSGSRTFAVILASIAIGTAIVTHGKLDYRLFGERHANKPLKNFNEFFPFYLTEHSDPTCKLMHVIGTCISTLFFLVWPMLLVSLATAVSVGFVLAEVASGLPNGAFEAVVMVVIFFTMNKLLLGRLAWQPILIGYFFAWVGHFVYEKNRPATFLYPSYSLASDYNMLYEIATG